MRSSAKTGKAKQPRKSAAATTRLQPASAIKLWLAAAALVVLVVAAYANSVGNGFVWDDHQQIVLNPSMRPDTEIVRLFTADLRFAPHSQGIKGSDYRPLQMLTYRLLFHGFGAEPSAFHLYSLVFAALSVLAVFAVFKALTRKLELAFTAAAVFAVYPVHTEAVDWIAALPELGMTLFALLSFWLFLKGRAVPTGRSRRWLLLALSLVAFAAALLWKETAVVLPLLIALYIALMEGGRRRKILVSSAPYWIVLAGYAVVRDAVLGSLGAGMRDWRLTPLQFLLNDIYLMLGYGWKLLWPFQLNAYHTFSPIRSVAEPRSLVVLLIVLILAAGAFALARRERAVGGNGPSMGHLRLGVFAAAWVLVTLLPAMNINALGRNPFTERYLYLPSVGFCLLLTLAAAWCLDRLPPQQRRFAGPGLATLVTLVFLGATVARNADWKDDVTLFGETLRQSPDAAFVRNMVAGGQTGDEAEANYREAARLATQQTPPDRVDAVVAYQGLASLYADRAQFQQAIEALDAAAAIDPDDADTDGERGLVLARSGHGRQAEPLLEHALAEEPNNENVLSALGLVAREDLHDPGRAESMFLKALAVHPDADQFAASQHNNLAAVYADQNNFMAAIEQMRLAVQIEPANPEYHVNLANGLGGAGRFTEARGEAETALRLAPNDPAALQVLQQLGNPKP